jgi:hypothetical protein
MTVLGAARAKVITGKMEAKSADEAIAASGITNPDDIQLLSDLFNGVARYQFKPQYGDDDIRRIMLSIEPNAQSDWPSYKMEVAVASDVTAAQANKAGFGGLVSPVVSLEAFDTTGTVVGHFGNTRMFVKLPYDGNSIDLAQVRVVTSADGMVWTKVDTDNIVLVRPKSNLADGYIAFWTDHFSYYAVADTTVEASTPPSSASSSGGGGGAIGWPLLMLGLIGLAVVRRKNG